MVQGMIRKRRETEEMGRSDLRTSSLFEVVVVKHRPIWVEVGLNISSAVKIAYP